MENKTLGNIIMVVGRSGSGKSTLVEFALEQIDNLDYLKTYTTRKPRTIEEEKQSKEYRFTTKDEYEVLRTTSLNWDHSEIYGNYYGTNIDLANSLLAKGKSLIINIPIEEKEINNIKAKYKACKFMVVLLDIDKKLTEERVLNGRPESESQRLKLENRVDVGTIRMLADYVFTCNLDIGLEGDKKRFCELIKCIL